jgi:hypothetical protein
MDQVIPLCGALDYSTMVMAELTRSNPHAHSEVLIEGMIWLRQMVSMLHAPFFFTPHGCVCF